MAPARRPGSQPTVSVDVAPVYELLMSLATISQVADHDTYEVGPEWLAAVRSRAGAELMEQIHQISQDSSDVWVNLITLAYGAPAPRDVQIFLDHLGETDADEVRLHMVGFYSRDACRNTPAQIIRRAISGDADAAREFLRTSYPDWEPWQAFLRWQLERDSETVKAMLVEIVERWAALVWAHESLTVMQILLRDADEKTVLMRELPMEQFIETATNGVEFVPRPGIHRVVMTPSYVNRPWVSHAEVGDTLILVYPVSDESVSAETDAPPLRLVRLSKALGDEKRLRILRTLADGDRTLMELADLFGVPKTTMHHHMITLRSAGLVAVGAGTKRYRLRHESLPDVGALLSGYLRTPAEPAVPPGSPARSTRASSPSSATSVVKGESERRPTPRRSRPTGRPRRRTPAPA
ncbi:MAG: ArsR/SmtB family transcription factor [Candidatus Limnocylindria bacterium]